MKKEFSQAGISLIQVMVSLAILAVAQLAMMRMSETQNKNTKTTEVKFESIEIINNIRNVLTDKDACRRTFGPILPYPGIPLTGAHDANSEPAGFIDEILNANGDVVYRSGATSMIGGTQVTIKHFSMSSSQTPASTITPGSKGRTHLEVTLDRTDKIFGAQEITKKILLNVNTVNNSGVAMISGCSTASTGDSIETIAEYVCKTIGGTYLATGRDGDGDCSDIAPFGLSTFSKPVMTPMVPAPVVGMGAEVYGPFSVTGITTLNGDTDIDGNLKMLAGHTVELESDRRLKHDIKTLKNILYKLKKIRGVSYVWNRNNEEDIGVIAQEIQSEFPELVRMGENGFLAVKYPQLTAVLIQAVKEMELNNKLKDKKIHTLGIKQSDLERRIKKLEEKYKE
jgi:hypothetical protein